MNIDIKELMKQAGTDTSGKWMSVDNAEKFAELIVCECCGMMQGFTFEEIAIKVIKKHFGVEE